MKLKELEKIRCSTCTYKKSIIDVKGKKRKICYFAGKPRKLKIINFCPLKGIRTLRILKSVYDAENVKKNR